MGRPERGPLELIFQEFPPKSVLAQRVAAKASFWRIFCLEATKSREESFYLGQKYKTRPRELIN